MLRLRSHPHLRLRSNPPIICIWRKQINAGDRAPRRFRLALWWLIYRLPVLDGINRETEELGRKHCKYSEEAWARDRADFQSQWEADACQAGEAVSVVSEARQSSRRLDTARPQRSAFPEVSQASTGCHAPKEVPNVLAGAARPTGLRTDGRERLNSPTLKCLNRRTGSGIQTSAYQDHAPIRTKRYLPNLVLVAHFGNLTTYRTIQSELLDGLPATDARAIRSRRDLKLINLLMGKLSMATRSDQKTHAGCRAGSR